VKERFAVDWKILLLSFLPRETRILGVIAAELMLSSLGLLVINHLQASE